MNRTYSSDWKDNQQEFPLEGGVLLVNKALEDERFGKAKALLIQHANLFTSSVKLPPSLLAPMTSRCYDTALSLAFKYDLVYVEGFVIFQTYKGPVSVAHAWNCTKVGVAADAIMHKHLGTPTAAFWGIPMNRDYVANQADQTGYVGVLDGRLDGVLSGVYHDDATLWKEVIHGN